MNTARSVKPPHILLIEPDNLVRGTLAGVCRDLGLARVHQATSVAAATGWLDSRDLQGILVALDEEGVAMELLTAVRAGKYACPAKLVIAVMSSTCTVETAKALKALDVMRFLLQPFKLRDAILTLEQMGVAAKAVVPTSAVNDASAGQVGAQAAQRADTESHPEPEPESGVESQPGVDADAEAEADSTSEAHSA